MLDLRPRMQWRFTAKPWSLTPTQMRPRMVRRFFFVIDQWLMTILLLLTIMVWIVCEQDTETAPSGCRVVVVVERILRRLFSSSLSSSSSIIGRMKPKTDAQTYQFSYIPLHFHELDVNRCEGMPWTTLRFSRSWEILPCGWSLSRCRQILRWKKTQLKWSCLRLCWL